MASAEIEGTALARILTNANAFVPAKSHFPYVRLRIGNGRVAVLASDGYTIASDYAECVTTDSDSAYLTLDGSKDLESLSRSARKLIAGLEINAEGLTITVGSEVAAIELVEDGSAHDLNAERIMFAADETLAVVAGKAELCTYCAFMPSLLMRFSKVKPVSGESIMDMKPTGDSSAVFVKIGQSFRGAIAPITRPLAPEGSLFDD